MDKNASKEKLVKVLKNPNVSRAHKGRAKKWLQELNAWEDSYDKYIDMTPQELYKLNKMEG